jgi:hypothetical protein
MMQVMTAATTTKPRRNIFRGLRRQLVALAHNPVTMKELRGRMRGRKAFIILTIHLSILSLIMTLIYFGFVSAARNPYGPEPQLAGKAVFGAVVIIQAIMVLFIGPAATAGAISGEKERQTYDILRTTLLTAEEFVSGKLLSALSYVFLLVVAAIPLQSIAFLLGGIALSEIIVSQLVIGVSAVAYALLGLYASSRLRSTLAASVATYGTAIFLTIGVPGLMLLGVFFLESLNYGGSRWIFEITMTYILVLLVSLNLPATLVMSEIVLLEESSLWGFSSSAGGYSYWIFSPWYVNVLIFAILAFVLYKVTVRRVRRIPV